MDTFTKILLGASVIGSSLLTTALISNRRMAKEMRELALTDSLTGIYNRRYLYLYLEKVIPNMSRSPLNNYAVIMDIDDFKKLNDTYGHSFGDTVLRGVTEEIQKLIRKGDCFCRYGGEEFVLILPSVADRKIVSIIERIRENIEKLRFPYRNETIQITMSFGVSKYEHEDDAHSMILKVDKALYQAKNTGKNRVCFYDEREEKQNENNCN